MTGADGVMRTSASSDHMAAMRAFIPWSLLAVAIAALAALVAYRGHRWAAVIFPLALLFGAEPLLYAGSLVGEMLAGVALFAGAGVSAVVFGRYRRVVALPLVAGVAGAMVWVIAILAVPDLFDSVDVARAPTAAGASLIGFIAIADRRRITEFMTGRSGPAFVDLAYLALALALLRTGLLGIIPTIPAFLGTGVAIAVYPVWRRATVAALEGLVTSRARRDASIRAVEDERSRLARDIHDSPLQELSGVIRRLEALPGAARETDTLRAVAGHLRDVATSLHPPVLQDLGLAPAIEDLRDQLLISTPEWLIGVAVDDLTRTGRPPAEVELAAYRVVQEATANAMAHSAGRSIQIRGYVTTDLVELEIKDDGRGIHDEQARIAKRAGHFGLDSMRERAEAIGGTMSLTSTPEGVGIRFKWESRT